ncbi:MAG: hypothetical protein ACK4UP_07350 [Spirosomataceae bacterium]
MTSSFSIKLIALLWLSTTLFCTAQTAKDHLFMPKKQICLLSSVESMRWNTYWEGNLYRDNPNIGTHKRTAFHQMAAIGITDRLNLLAHLPYVSTQNSAGNLMGQSGWQDVQAHLKYLISKGKSTQLIGIIGGGLPTHRYNAEFQPMSIGAGCSFLSSRLVLTHSVRSFYVTGYSGFQRNGISRLDRNAYLLGDQLIYSSRVQVPDIIDLGVKIGRYKNGFQAEIGAESFFCPTGDNIARNGMPALTNKRSGVYIHGFLRYQPKNLGVILTMNQTLTGRNNARSTGIQTGILYQFSTKK